MICFKGPQNNSFPVHHHVSIFVPVLKLNDDIFLYTCKISLLGSLDVISGDILDRRDGRILIILKFLSGVRSL